MPTIRLFDGRTSSSHRAVLLSDGTSFSFKKYVHGERVLEPSHEDIRRHNQYNLDTARRLCQAMGWSWPRTLASTLALARAGAETVLS